MILRALLASTAAFSLLFAGVWLLKALFGRWLSARAHYAVWGIVLAGMLLMPIAIASPIRFSGLLSRQQAEFFTRQARRIGSGIASAFTPDDLSAASPVSGSVAQNDAVPNAQSAEDGVYDPSVESALVHAHFDWQRALLVVWLGGSAISGAWLFCSGIRLKRRVMCCALLETPPDIDSFTKRCAKTLGLKKSVTVALQPILHAPAAMGLLRPILAIPESAAQDCGAGRLRHILTHELAHIRRGDLFVIAGLNLLGTVYWFNPLIWLFARCVRTDMEISCDNDVLRALGRNERRSYIETIIYFSGVQVRRCERAALSLNDARFKLKKRIGGMYMQGKTKPATIAATTVLLAALLVIALSAGCMSVANAVNSQVTPQPVPTLGVTATPGISATPGVTATPNATSTPGATAIATGGSRLYKNTMYGFQMELPQDWIGYTIVRAQWQGEDNTTGKVSETGPEIIIRNPKWTGKKPYQDIPIMVFTLGQWDAIQKDTFSLGAVPISPTELGRNASYVFALPARYNYAYPTGWEQVQEYLDGKPLRTFAPAK